MVKKRVDTNFYALYSSLPGFVRLWDKIDLGAYQKNSQKAFLDRETRRKESFIVKMPESSGGHFHFRGRPTSVGDVGF